MEAKRQLHVLDQRLAGRPFILGKDYSIADIASFPWYDGVMLGWWPFDAAEFLSAHEYSNVLRWAESLVKRPAVQRGRRVNSTRSELPGMLRERHDARDSES
jgi:GST-like protein